MANEYITCAQCNELIKVSGNNRTVAKRRTDWLERNRKLCVKCEKNAWLEGAAKASADNVASGLVQLTGSERQVLYGDELRARLFAKLRAALPLIELARSTLHFHLLGGDEVEAHRMAMRTTINQLPAPLQHEAPQLAREMLEAFGTSDRYAVWLQLLEEETQASWWIECGQLMPVTIAKAMKERVLQHMDAQATALPDMEMLAQRVSEEALLMPQGEPIHAQEVTIRVSADEICVVFPHRLETFRQLMRRLNFRWRNNRWVRLLDERTGAPTDRQAQTAHELLGAGFMVRLLDADARALAISGEFMPEHTRWVGTTTHKQSPDWFFITWLRPDDLYAAAKRLLGAWYVGGGVAVPKAAADEVMDFAAAYDFKLTQSASNLAQTRLNELSQGQVVSAIMTPIAAKKANTGMPSKLEALAAHVAPDLMDDTEMTADVCTGAA